MRRQPDINTTLIMILICVVGTLCVESYRTHERTIKASAAIGIHSGFDATAAAHHRQSDTFHEFQAGLDNALMKFVEDQKRINAWQMEINNQIANMKLQSKIAIQQRTDAHKE
jgi:hypothetical protein